MRVPSFGIFLGLGLLVGVSAAAPLRVGVELADRPISFVGTDGRPTGFTP
jgi:hypothetical protein